MSISDHSSFEDVNLDDVDVFKSALFEESIVRAESYPTNLAYHQNYSYQLEEYQKQIEKNAPKLFGTQNIVDFLEFRDARNCSGEAPRDTSRFRE